MVENKANDRELPTVEEVWEFGRFILVLAAVFAWASLLGGVCVLLWAKSANWVFSEDRGPRYLCAAGSFGLSLAVLSGVTVLEESAAVRVCFEPVFKAASTCTVVDFFLASIHGLLAVGYSIGVTT